VFEDWGVCAEDVVFWCFGWLEMRKARSSHTIPASPAFTNTHPPEHSSHFKVYIPVSHPLYVTSQHRDHPATRSQTKTHPGLLSLQHLKSALPCISTSGLSTSCISLTWWSHRTYFVTRHQSTVVQLTAPTKANSSSLEASLGPACRLPSCRSPDYPSSFGASSRSSR
jgi:hypothetical protein